MRFIDPQRDRWKPVLGEDGPMPHPDPAPDRLLTPEQWRAARDHWPERLPVALSLPNDADVEALEPDLSRVAMLALQFPKWTDGRAYSQARLLRARLRYAGEVRATGEVLVDMLPLLVRTGFDSALLRAGQSLTTAERVLDAFGGHYQGALDEPRPLFARPAEEQWRRAREFVDTGAAI